MVIIIGAVQGDHMSRGGYEAAYRRIVVAPNAPVL
jgi:hypothetical protein